MIAGRRHAELRPFGDVESVDTDPDKNGVDKLGPKFVALDRDFRTLEGGHFLAETLDGLRVLSAEEHACSFRSWGRVRSIRMARLSR